jgi:hypothetical protein
MQFFSAIINGNPHTPVFYLEVMACTLATVAVLGTYSERKRPGFKRWIQGVLQGFKARLPGATVGKPMAQ